MEKGAFPGAKVPPNVLQHCQCGPRTSHYAMGRSTCPEPQARPQSEQGIAVEVKKER